GEGVEPAVLLASYTDGLEVAPIIGLADGRSNGESASDALWAAVAGDLAAMHPGTNPGEPLGTAFMHWGSDAREIGWTYWRAGHNSDAIIASARPPVPGLPIHVAGESFSRAQAWVEGALQTAAAVADLVLASEPPA